MVMHFQIDPFILRTNPFPVHCNIQQMYSGDGFVTRLLFAELQMCAANYITTCGCTDGNISAPAGAHTKTGRCLAVAVTHRLWRLTTGMVWPVFHFQVPATARVDRSFRALKYFRKELGWLGTTGLFQFPSTCLWFSSFLDLTKRSGFIWFIYYLFCSILLSWKI